MTGKTKIQISEPELELVMNSEWILTKSNIIAKVYELFAEESKVIDDLLRAMKPVLPWGVQNKGPKISRGEQYKGLPYVILDYPSLFSKDEIFALRTMFWWGNYFSIQLHIRGSNELIRKKLKRCLDSNMQYYVNISEDEWSHEFKSGHYKVAGTLAEVDISRLSEKKFLKIALVYDLKNWNNISALLKHGYTDIFNLLKD